ncbi:MAG TPA: VOC family protein [Candidatus Nitrosocosmicus sp.]|nr:VOC family protein [Candidatus Nitrosocosmicus sp.]
MSFRKLGAVILLVSDMNKSVQFYEEILNIPLKKKSDEWTEFFNKETVLALHPAKNKERVKSGQHILVGFSASDFDQTMKNLQDKKVIFFKNPREEGFGKHAIIEDPDGHLISIVKLKENPLEGDGFDFLGLVGAE